MIDLKNLGPNMRKLFIEYISREAVPPGGGMADALDFINNTDTRHKVIESAEEKINCLLDTLRVHLPQYTDEQLAGILLDKLIEHRNKSGVIRK